MLDVFGPYRDSHLDPEILNRMHLSFGNAVPKISLNGLFRGSAHSNEHLFNGKSDMKAQLLPIYHKILEENSINDKYADYLLAQTALEATWKGKTSGVNNIIGMKVPDAQKGKGLGTAVVTHEEYDGAREKIVDEFKNYSSIEECLRDQIGWMIRHDVFIGKPEGFAQRVKDAGYATDSKYVAKINNIVASLKLGGLL